MIEITKEQLQMLNHVHNAAPDFFSELLRRFPVPSGGMGDAAGSDWISSVSGFITQNLPTYLNYQAAKSLIQTNAQQQSYTPAQTQAVLQQQGVAVASPNYPLWIGVGVLGLIGVGLVVSERGKRKRA